MGRRLTQDVAASRRRHGGEAPAAEAAAVGIVAALMAAARAAVARVGAVCADRVSQHRHGGVPGRGRGHGGDVSRSTPPGRVTRSCTSTWRL